MVELVFGEKRNESLLTIRTVHMLAFISAW